MTQLSATEADQSEFFECHSTSDALAELEKLMPGWITKVDFGPDRREFHLKLNFIVVGDLWVSTTHSNTGFLIEGNDLNVERFGIQLVESGRNEVVCDDEAPCIIENGQVHLSKSAGRYSFICSPNSRHINISAPLTKLANLLPPGIGDPDAYFKSLTPLLPASHPIARLIFQTARIFQTAEPENSPLFATLQLSVMFKQTLLKAFVLGWPQSDGGFLAKRRPISATMRRALYWIHANLAEKMTVADVAKAAHSSPRNIQKRFRDELDTSLVHYLTKLRLQRLHAALKDVDNNEMIVNIAERHGLGRKSDFEKSYKKQYGCTPSETRRLSRLL